MLHERQETGGNFLSVKHGGLCLESKEEKDGYTLITGEVDGKPYEKWIKKFGSLDGFITKIEWYERSGDYGTFRGVKIHVKDRAERYQIDLPYEKRPYDTFTKVMDNIDFSEPVEFVAWPDRKGSTVGGHIPTAFAIKQGGDFVKWKYTKEDMGDCPPAKQLRSGKWSFDDQREWLLERLLTVIIPKVDALNEFDEPMPEYAEEKATAAFATRNDPQAPVSSFKEVDATYPRKMTGKELDDIPF